MAWRNSMSGGVRATLILLLLALAPAAPRLALAQPAASREANAVALEKIIIGEDKRDPDLIREAMSGGAQRRAGIRALGRLEQPELIRWVAPALGDGVGIRAEAAWALAQLARTPEAVAQVQSLLIERAEQDAGAGTVGGVGRAGSCPRTAAIHDRRAGRAHRVAAHRAPALA